MGPDDERILLKNALDQVELADSLGFDCVWAVEHHFLESTPTRRAEVFLAAASQRPAASDSATDVQLPVGFNHPARIAERIATLDLVSDGG